MSKRVYYVPDFTATEELVIEFQNVVRLNETTLAIIEQKWINANNIKFRATDRLNLYDANNKWHGYVEGDYDNLNNRLCKHKSKICKLHKPWQVRLFFSMHNDLYNSYFLRPIRALETNETDQYLFISDGRHRIIAAQKANTKIPVFVVKYVSPQHFNSVQDYCKWARLGPWLFEKEK